jgi:Tol biopolymer transport system component
MLPGTEDVGQSSLTISFTGDDRTLVYQGVGNQQLFVGEFDLSAGTTRRLLSVASAVPFEPVVSANGNSIAALQDSGVRTQTSAPLFQVIVFPR